MMLDDAARRRHFEALYAHDEDPWQVRAAWYERRKRAVLLAALGRPSYRSAFEPGCGNGELSASLAARCERLLACDGAAGAVAAARRRLQGDALAHGALRIEQRSLPAQWPRAERFDLVVVSELGYYFDAGAWRDLVAQAASNLEEEGELLMCHYVHDFDDRAASTASVHAAADAIPALVRTVQHRDADFLLEVWTRRAA
ncbi:methyltransferase domain-containing protein [uncultured Massilia sp.]|uniref:methyltransferase domain-containing protein n=1 Tax=uncultured Massilia sp. TaxID=169973 RepID=UPI0025CE4833|nr:methyltransferase domain-containing protein [uncultured Massilia sp.]